MLKLRNDVLRWGRSDVFTMARLIGPDNAVVRHMPYNPAVLHALATKKTIQLSTRAQAAYADERALRGIVRQMKRHPDDTAQRKDERRGFKHQREALNFFRATTHTGYLVADETGVGKTLQALWFASKRVKARRVLILTRNIAKEQWAEAIPYWIGARETVSVVDGTSAQQTRQLTGDARWVVAHWESLAFQSRAYLEQRWDVVIGDEAHMICNRDAARSKVAHRLKAAYRMACTAHPYTNDPGELFSILRFLFPRRYTSYWRFFHMHVKASPKQFGGFEIEGALRPKLLAWELAPFMLRRLKTDVYKSLPAITRTPRRMHLTARGEKDYHELKRKMFAALKGRATRLPIVNEFVRLTRVRQYLVDPGLIGGSERSLKYPVVYELMQEVNKPLVVFSEFAEALQRLGQFLRKCHIGKRAPRIAHIHGGMKKGSVSPIKKRFGNGDIDALLVVGKSGDAALNLGGFGFLAHLDLPWNPRGLEQREGRVDRPQENTGKLVPTSAYHVIVAGTFEERLMKKLEQRNATFRKVFSPEDYRELFA